MQEIQDVFAESLAKVVFNPVLILFLCALIIAIVIKVLLYKRTTYYKETKAPYLKVHRDSGRYGEYLIYKYLSSFEKDGCRFLFNVYLPKDNGETSELDVVALCKEGIFVFESKNYSGWIFGDEKQKMWTQVLPGGKGKSRKEHFYNPIFQNRTHIRWLKEIVGDEIPIYSVIVFSERCTFKKLEVSDEVPVIYRDKVFRTVKSIREKSVSETDVQSLYNILKPYTEVSDEVKQQHIDNIKIKNK
ncbi:MAG: NERD domain-containing protein [Clostridia bacterium]|nr:NERD domain-containing protein [Clostridia bacterium]